MALFGLAVLLIASLLLGTGYAVRTPLWQNPDEPAHFNYVVHFATTGTFPILRPGDWDQGYLEQLTARKFPPDMPVDRLRYESHQPPLYYALGALVLRGTPGLMDAPVERQVRALRLFSVLLGAAAAVPVYLAVKTLFPQPAWVSWATVGFMTALPQRTAVNAAVSNDALTELMAGLLLWWLVGLLRTRLPPPSWRSALLPGLLVGLALLTKLVLYLPLLSIPVALWKQGGGRRALAWAVRIGLIALLVSGWWFARNLLVYGPRDPFGLVRHDQVVAGQPRPERLDWAAAQHFLTTAYRSFWVQLGWMAVPANDRTYLLLLVPTAAAALGLVVLMGKTVLGQSKLTALQRRGLALLALWVLLVAAQMVLYNLRYIQPQGRYLYPAIGPLALAFVLGWRELLAPQYAGVLMVAIIALFLLFNVYVLVWLVPYLA